MKSNYYPVSVKDLYHSVLALRFGETIQFAVCEPEYEGEMPIGWYGICRWLTPFDSEAVAVGVMGGPDLCVLRLSDYWNTETHEWNVEELQSFLSTDNGKVDCVYLEDPSVMEVEITEAHIMRNLSVGNDRKVNITRQAHIQMHNISEATLNGFRAVPFNVDAEWYEDVRKLFEDRGYTFEPMEECGEYIRW